MMICILKIENGEINGWIIATDLEDAKQQAQGIGNFELIDDLAELNEIKPGKHVTASGFTMLVS